MGTQIKQKRAQVVEQGSQPMCSFQIMGSV